jgi:hypothetical protein
VVPPTAYVPAAHGEQPAAPLLATKLPAAQLEQPAAPPALYAPAPQLTHWLLPGA